MQRGATNLARRRNKLFQNALDVRRQIMGFQHGFSGLALMKGTVTILVGLPNLCRGVLCVIVAKDQQCL